MRKQSSELFKRANTVIPGGVNSPVRAFGAVGGEPVFIRRASGSQIEDVDGNQYIDYVCSWGPLILGHAHPSVLAAVVAAAERGTTFGAPTEGEVVLAEMLVEAVPSLEEVRLVSSGTEAVMSALRLARGVTRRDLVVKLEGCYHGAVDSLLVKAGSGLMTMGLPASPGVPQALAEQTLLVPYNDGNAIQELVEARGDEIAALIVEPVPGNMGLVLPAEGYLELLRELCDEYGIVLIFDEVISGFRVGYAGAQGLYGVTPDLTTLGKIVGGGLPLGAYGGRRSLMEAVAPVGAVYQAGTLSGNPLAVAAGIETLRQLQAPGVYEALARVSDELVDGLRAAAGEAGVELGINQLGSAFTPFFGTHKVVDYRSAQTADLERHSKFFHAMLERGVYLPPSQFECCFVSTAHSGEDVQRTLDAARGAFQQLAG